MPDLKELWGDFDPNSAFWSAFACLPAIGAFAANREICGSRDGLPFFRNVVQKAPFSFDILLQRTCLFSAR